MCEMMKNILLNFMCGIIGMALIIFIARILYLLFIIKLLIPIVIVLLIIALIYTLGDMIRYYINFSNKRKK